MEIREEHVREQMGGCWRKDMKTKKENKEKIRARETDVIAYPEWSFGIVIHRMACLD